MLSFRIIPILAAASFVAAWPAHRRQEGGAPSSLLVTAPIPYPTAPTGTFPTAPFPTGSGAAFPTGTGSFPSGAPAVHERDYNWYPAQPLPARA